MAAQVACKKCDCCTTCSNAEYFCFECKKALCKTCRNAHKSFPNLQGHKITRFQCANLSIQNALTACTTHAMDFSLYCSNCDSLVCSKCVTTVHAGHSYLDISEISANARKSVNVYLTKINKNLCDYNVKEKDITLELSVLEKMISDKISALTFIEGKIETAIKCFKKAESLDIENVGQLGKEDLQDELKNITRCMEQNKELKSKCESILSENHDIIFYQEYKTIKNELADIDYMECNERRRISEDKNSDLFVMRLLKAISTELNLRCEQCEDYKRKSDEMKCQTKETEQRYIDEIRLLHEKIEGAKLEFEFTKQICSADVDGLKQQKKALEIEVQTLKKQLIASKHECERCAETEHEVEAFRNEMQYMTINHNDRYTALTEKNKQMEHEIQRLDKQNNQVKQDNKHKEKDIQELKTQISHLNQNSSEVEQRHCINIEEIKDELQSIISSQGEQIHKMNIHIRHLRNAIYHLRSRKPQFIQQTDCQIKSLDLKPQKLIERENNQIKTLEINRFSKYDKRRPDAFCSQSLLPLNEQSQDKLLHPGLKSDRQSERGISRPRSASGLPNINI